MDDFCRVNSFGQLILEPKNNVIEVRIIPHLKVNPIIEKPPSCSEDDDHLY